MNINKVSRKLTVAAAIAGAATSALLFLGSGTALAVQDISEAAPHDAISTLMIINCTVPPAPESRSECDQISSLSWWPEPRPTAVVPQGWLAP